MEAQNSHSSIAHLLREGWGVTACLPGLLGPLLCANHMLPLLETAARPSSPSILNPALACHSLTFFELELSMLRCPTAPQDRDSPFLLSLPH